MERRKEHKQGQKRVVSNRSGEAQQQGKAKPFPTWALALGTAVVLIGALSQLLPGSVSKDEISEADKASIEQGYNEAIQQGTSLVRPLGGAELEAIALAGGLLALGSDAEQKAMIKDVQAGVSKAVEFTLWDNLAQDGDVVTLSSSLYSARVDLFNAPVKVIVPYVEGEPVIMTGAYDGGGGITVSATTDSGPLSLPYMRVGQILPIAVP